MLKEFEDKLQGLKEKRKIDWQPIRDLESEINDIRKQIPELDAFLEEVGIDTKDKKNAYHKRIKNLQQKKKIYPVYGTECIDRAIGMYHGSKKCNDTILNELMVIMNNPEKKSIRYDAALLLAPISKVLIERSPSYESSLVYKDYMEKAFSFLVTGEDADLYYAQWGNFIYDTCLPKLLKEGDRKHKIIQVKIQKTF